MITNPNETVRRIVPAFYLYIMGRQRPQDAVLKALQSYDPRQPGIASKKLAAYSQLATAIWLWFNYGDPVSIHTLAAASQGILESLAGKTHQLPHMRNWTKKFPRRVQKILRDPQNYFKHGWTDKNKSLRYESIYRRSDDQRCLPFASRLNWTYRFN